MGVGEGVGRFQALPEESAVEYSRMGGESAEPSVYRREDDEVGGVGEVDETDEERAGAGAGAVFRGRHEVYSPSSLSRQVSASVYRND